MWDYSVAGKKLRSMAEKQGGWAVAAWLLNTIREAPLEGEKG